MGLCGENAVRGILRWRKWFFPTEGHRGFVGVLARRGCLAVLRMEGR